MPGAAKLGGADRIAESGPVPGRGDMMAVAPGVMMGDAFFGIVRCLVAISVKMLGTLFGRRNAVEPFGGMRRRSRPQGKDEEQRANEVGPTGHRTDH